MTEQKNENLRESKFFMLNHLDNKIFFWVNDLNSLEILTTRRERERGDIFDKNFSIHLCHIKIVVLDRDQTFFYLFLSMFRTRLKR